MRLLTGAVALGTLAAACAGEVPTGASAQHLSTAQCSAYEVGGRVVICHATGSARNPISVIRVSEAACINAHSDHEGDYVAVNGDCGPNACLPQTAPCDATLRCCDGLTCSAGTCVDIDACADNACGANATCTDLAAPALGDASGRTCACDPGYTGDGLTCTDIDACAANACGANATCTDLAAPAPGDASGRSCACDAGYEGDGLTCTDIDACAANPCDANATCADRAAPAPGDASGRTCACNPGYTGDGASCSDINECGTNNGGCSANATCTNNPGALPTCACNTGYTGNGLTCTASAAVTQYYGTRITSVQGFASFRNFSYSPSAPFTEGSMEFWMYGQDASSYSGCNGDGWAYYSNGGGYAATRVMRTDGADFGRLEFVAADGWGQCHNYGYVEVYNNGVLQGAFDIEGNANSTVYGFTGSFDELRVAFYYSVSDRNTHSFATYSAGLIDRVTFGTP